MDGDFSIVPDDAPYAAGEVDEETGEIRGQLSEQAPVVVPQATGRRDPAEFAEQQGGNWQPSAEELAEIQAREQAEASGQQTTTSRPRRERGGMSME